MPKPEYQNKEGGPTAEESVVAHSVVANAVVAMEDMGIDRSAMANALLRLYVGLCVIGWSYDFPRVRTNAAEALNNAINEEGWKTPETIEQYLKDTGATIASVPKGMIEARDRVLAERAAEAQKEKVVG